MTVSQKILKLIYPLFSFFKGKTGAAKTHVNPGAILPPVPFYSLKTELSNGTIFPFENLRGKKVLLVNTASDCGYTFQYEELQRLYELSKENLEIIAFPSNDFKEQEKGSDEEIARFCSTHFNISFLLARKSHVARMPGQNPVFSWLTSQGENGWNSQVPAWNFSKYLVNENGILTHYFGPALSPVSEVVIRALND
jgi:glutathione peroxidase